LIDVQPSACVSPGRSSSAFGQLLCFRGEARRHSAIADLRVLEQRCRPQGLRSLTWFCNLTTNDYRSRHGDL
ncbi:hypothetical protein EJB05_54799, partial [Eragrostis curvula]